MTAAQVQPKLTYAEYLKAEEASSEKHDFISGDVLAMAGGTIEHAALAAAISGELRTALRSKRCRVFSADLRVRVDSTDATFYPDVSVVCGTVEASPDDRLSVMNPVVLVEVLSETTEAYDRGVKAAHYRRLASLREYVLVSQSEKRIEVQRRNEHGIWELHFYGPGENAELTSLSVRVAVDSVYANPLETP